MNPGLLNQFQYVSFKIDVNFFSFAQKQLFSREIWSKNSKQPFYNEACFLAWFKYAKIGSDVYLDDDELFSWYGWPTKVF